MKRLFLVAALLAAGSVQAADNTAAAASATAAPAAARDDGNVFYSMGFMTGKNVQSAIEGLDVEKFVAGFRDGYGGKQPQVAEDTMRKLLTDYKNRRMEEDQAAFQRAAQENKAKGEAFLAENAKKAGVKATASGLQYEVLREGTGASPKASDTVEVHYEGKLIDGTVFDSSIARNQTATFRLDQVIPGWTEGVQLMKEGAKYRFVIPSDKGYGEMGAGAIPPNAVLVFEVELIKVTRDESAKAAEKPAAKKKGK
ncbi:FKBP-type peptidyl-prolyl cis-trans isomerase FklB [Fluviicoccus keumensis]|uniref:Peptidyl-prolyl cis-trans isomerase n=1 Tax=Fluviicoccus keumensis TaxID=1435465 RepID=A0A4Q7ZBB4_9GAMM|nr:FKBP-type peptidyl-prolyl cis-trans isomerase [Fluviicoccus keumensis]RZU47902.1 FKBP-type peptidyl-prolyl cis-trans isomerase FklB [Fluviicoccus keumensis]